MCHVLPPAGFVFQNPDHQVVMPTVGADVAFGLGRSAFQFSICVLLFLYAVSNYAMWCSFFMLQVLSGVICQFLAAYSLHTDALLYGNGCIALRLDCYNLCGMSVMLYMCEAQQHLQVQAQGGPCEGTCGQDA